MVTRYFSSSLPYDPIPEQTDGNYEDYRRIRAFEDVGYFLESYVVSGGVVTPDVTHNNIVEATDIVVSLSNELMTRNGTDFRTRIASTTYYLDFSSSGDWAWGTTHPDGTAGTDYLTIASVTTDTNGNVDVITDTRASVGGFRLRSGFNARGYVRPVYNALDYATGDGVTDDYAAISSLLNEIGSAQRTVLFAQGAFRFSSSITFPENITVWVLQGATLVPDSGRTVTVNGPFSAGLYQVFAGSGTIAGSMKVPNLYPQWWGAKGDGTTDDTASLLATIAHAAANLPTKIYFAKGTYLYTSLGNLAYSGLTIEGANDRGAVLKCTSSSNNHNAIYMDAFESGSPSDQFVQRCNLEDITVEGNTKTASIFNVQGLARCNWRNVVGRVGEPTAGIAFNFKGVQLCNFDNLFCSTDLDNPMSTKPYYGLFLDHGVRASVSVGRSTNNRFSSCYFEGMPIGMRLYLADQNTFIGGSAESNTVYSCIVNEDSRYNTFIGMAFESPDASSADFLDGGFSTQLINCYTVKSILFQGDQAKLSGGTHERVEVQSGAIKTCIENLQVNYHNTGSGGFVDAGTATEWKNILQITDHVNKTGSYIYPLKPRVAITVGASPFTYTNNTGQYIEIVIQTGTISQILGNRPGIGTYLCPITVPGKLLLAPLDSIEVTYSVAPSMSYLPHNGFQG